MKVWDEDFVVKQLAAARKKAEASREEDAEKRNSSIDNNKKPEESPIAFLLVLVRKFAHKHYEFIYIAANCYEKVEQVYNKTNVVLTHAVSDGDNQDDQGCHGVWIGRSAEQQQQQQQQQQQLFENQQEEEEEEADDSDNDSNDDIFYDSNDKENDNDNNDNEIDNSNSSFKINSKFESYHVGKAIFHTASGEPLMKMEGSTGWKEAMKQKYQNLDARSRFSEEKQDEKNHTAAKAMAAAALGGGAAAGGASVVAASSAAAATTAAIEAGTAYGAGAFAASGGFGAGYYGAGAGLAGYGASYGAGYGAASGLGYGAASYGAGYGAASGLGYGAASYGAGATGASSWASWAAANGIAASGTSATSAGATTAAAGVMAPVGVIAAAGAATGLGIYYVIHRRNQARKAREKAVQEGVPSAEKIHEEDSTVVTEEDSSSDGEAPSGYLPLSCDTEIPGENCSMNLWVSLFAKRVDDDDNHCVFVPVVCANQLDAEREWIQAANETIIAKALFDPEGKVVQLKVDPADHDGWETALALHYDFLEDHNVITCLIDDEDTEENTPLLEDEPKVVSQRKPTKFASSTSTPERAPPTNTNWVFEAIRTKRQQISNIRVPGPGAILAMRQNKASA